MKTLHAVCTEFDNVVRESRERAQRAAELIPEIEENIGDAENSTRAALTALHDADKLATTAEQLALTAQNTSDSALLVRRVAV